MLRKGLSKKSVMKGLVTCTRSEDTELGVFTGPEVGHGRGDQIDVVLIGRV